MPFSVWAVRLAEIDAGRIPLESLGLHLADTIAIASAGFAAREGKLLLEIHGTRSMKLAGVSGLSAMAGAIRLSEMDDIHLETCITPSSAIVPTALAVAAIKGATPETLARGLVAGYATMLRNGRAHGGAALLGKGIWPTIFGATIGAAATASVMLGLSPERTATALRLALLRTIGKLGHPPGALPARWFVFGESVADGYMAALGAAHNLTTDEHIDANTLPEGAKDFFSQPVNPAEVEEISFKPFCTARQAATGVFTFSALLKQHRLTPEQIAAVEVEVPSPTLDMVTSKLNPASRLSTLINMGFQVAAAALSPATLFDIERDGPHSPALLDFATRVQTKASPELDALFPKRWAAKVTIKTKDGRQLTQTTIESDGDPGTPFGLDRIQEKVKNMPEALLKDAAAAVSDAAALTRLVGRFRA